MKSRLEKDSHKTGEVKVAYEASVGETIVFFRVLVEIERNQEAERSQDW
jgi:hypothetical protein